MLEIYSESNIDQCQKLWEQHIPQQRITDLWDVRACFHQHYNRKPLFVVAKEDDTVVGLIPLSFIEENNCYGYFPGEVWQGKTWLEQNRLIVRDQMVFEQMIAWLDQHQIRYNLRYLTNIPAFAQSTLEEDEIGYLFFPEQYQHNLDNYYREFSKRSIKTIKKEVEKMHAQSFGVSEDDPRSFDQMVQYNIERFGDYSYFVDQKFLNGFRSLRDFLQKQGWLKMTTVMLDNQVAAVDMGCIYKGVYVLLAGGTSANFPGVAKVINLHHLRVSCLNQYTEVDFLCGDFFWKKIFHLAPRPLYKLNVTADTKLENANA